MVVHNTIWDKFSGDIKKEFDSEPIYNKNIFKAKIKSYDDEVPDCYNKEVPMVDSNHACSVVISLGSAIKKEKNYYLKVLLKECKYSKKKVIRHITQDVETFSRDSDEE